MLTSWFNQPAIVPWDYKSDIEIDLVVWHDGTELKYIYTPGSDINFVTTQQDQNLTIRLAMPPTEPGRFKIHSYHIRHKKMCQEAKYWDGTIFQKIPASDGYLFKTLPEQVKFHLRLIDEGTYITINVLDSQTNMLIVCDPQVENGTKT
jgi:hypothetical protein